VPEYAAISASLNELTKSGKPFVWSEAQEEAFNRPLLTSSPILSYPTSEGIYILDMDASDFGMGAVLSQLQDGEEHVIAYANKTLNDA